MQVTIKETKKTPFFSINGNNVDLAGRSIPEDAVEFYDVLVGHVKKLISEKHEQVVVTIKLDYVNSASKKALVQLIKYFEQAHETGDDIIINWYYDHEDDDMKETGEDLKSVLSVPFILLTN